MIIGILHTYLMGLSAVSSVSLILSFEEFSLINMQSSMQMTRCKSTRCSLEGEVANVLSCLTTYAALVHS